MPLDPQLLFRALLDSGIKGFAGVPCSILNHLILEAEASEEVDYVAASVEGEAVAAASGMWLAGGLGAVLMQNSGLGNAVNPIASLSIPYQIPVLLIVSWRGEPGQKDAVHHFPMGEATPGLFDLLGIPTTVLREGIDLRAAVDDAVRYLTKERKPSALIVPRGVFAKQESDRARPAPILAAKAPSAEPTESFEGGDLPSRSEVLAAWLRHFPDALAVSTTGYMSREVASLERVDRHFPMQGSMGFAPAIALGLCRGLPRGGVHILDGDGALIMRMGSLATIGAVHPQELIHLVVDNGTYASTGGQLTVSPRIDFAGVARACGYRAAATCRGVDALDPALDWLSGLMGKGPLLLHVTVDEREAVDLQRPKLSPAEIAASFRASVLGTQA